VRSTTRYPSSGPGMVGASLCAPGKIARGRALIVNLA
jgi:hypothetical protein